MEYVVDDKTYIGVLYCRTSKRSQNWNLSLQNTPSYLYPEFQSNTLTIDMQKPFMITYKPRTFEGWSHVQ